MNEWISTEEANSKEKQHHVKTKVTSKNGNFTLNEKAPIKKKIKSCKDQLYDLRIYCSITALKRLADR